MLNRHKINLSSDLTEALNKQKPYSKRGNSLARDVIALLDTTVQSVAVEIQDEIDRLYNENIQNNEISNSLSEQLNKIRSNYFILPEKLREDVDSISRTGYSITVFGRTMAGKSTLMEILTHGDGKSIGNGKQRFTRDVRTYSYKKLRITDVPGVAAFEGKDDEDIAFNAARKCDQILFLINDDDVQSEVAECLSRIFSLGKPVMCIINVKQGISDSLSDKEMKMFRNRLNKKFNMDRINAIKNQMFAFGTSYGQDWHSIRFAYVHLKAAYMAQQPQYEQYADELLELSRFEYVDRMIVDEVSQKGGFYKLKSYADIVTVPIVDSVETLFSQSIENSRQGTILVEKNRDLKNWIHNFDSNGKTQIETYLTSLSSRLKREASAFAEDNYDNPKANKKWDELIAKQDIEAGAQRVLDQLAKECESELKELSREVDFDINFSYKISSEDSLRMHHLVDGRRAWNWATSLLSGGLIIAGIFTGGAAIAVGGFITGGLGFLGNILFKDYEKKASDARRKLERKLNEHIDKTIVQLRRKMQGILRDDLINKYMYPMSNTLNEAIKSLFALSDLQYEFALKMNAKLEEINKATITEALAYIGFQGLEWHIEGIARIPGYAVMLVLGDGKRFPDEAVRQLYFLLKERIWFVFKKDNLKSMLSQAIGKGLDRTTINIQKINNEPRIAHIPSLASADSNTKVRLRMAQQLTGLLITE